jgi:hypothetical protein
MQCEFIFCILEIDKSYFDVHLSDVLCRWVALRTDNLSSGRLE